MLLALGILGVVQSCFLPGAILHLFLLGKTKCSQFIVESFGLSLVINYILVFTLIFLGSYSQSVIITIFGLECLILFTLVYKLKIFDSNYLINRFKVNKLKYSSSPILFVGRICFILIFLYALRVNLLNLGEIFYLNDSVVSWNFWATNLAQNFFPSQLTYYPLLFPALNSIPYVFMDNTEIQFFSFFICLLYVPIAILALYRLYGSKYSFACLVAALFVIAWTVKFWHYHAGFADVPVMTTGTIAFTSFLNWLEHQGSQNKNYIYIVFVLAAGVGVTKQAGLVWFALLPCFSLYCNRVYAHGKLDSYKNILLSTLLMALIALPWYAYVKYAIAQGYSSYSIDWVTEGIHQGRSWFSRALLAFEKYPLIFVAAFLAIPSLFVRTYRIISLVGLILFVSWVIFFSYDYRNVSLAIPFLGFSLGFYGKYLGLLSKMVLDKIKVKYLFAAIFLFAIVFFLLCGVYSAPINEYLYNRQEKKLFYLGDLKELNEKIVKVLSHKPGKILTHYKYINFLPGIDRNLTLQFSGETLKVHLLKNDFEYLLIEETRVPSYLNTEELINLNKIFQESGWIMYQYNKVVLE